MRGSRTWFALFLNWLLIFGLVISGGFHVTITLCAVVVIVASFVIVSGEMKWWKADIANLQSAMKQLGKTTATMVEQQEMIKNIPVAKATLIIK